MKKVLGVVLVLVCLLLAGCGTKETAAKDAVLSCSKLTENTVDFVTEMVYYYSSGKIVKLGVNYEYDLSKYTDEQRQLFASAKMCETDAIKTQLGMVGCTEQLFGDKYLVSGFSEKLLEQAVGSLDVVKASYESQGWTCTTK